MPSKLLFALAFLGIMSNIQAQELMPLPDTSAKQAISLDQVIFSASKFQENKKHVSQTIQLIPRQEMEWIMPQNTGVLLEQTGNVFVQRSQLGGGSPVLRGFEASRVLLVIDGVRMNNAIYRAGHLQNIITVDNNLLDRVEVMYGPASTLYGSDALGGVIVMNSKQPMLSATGRPLVKANAMTRYSSAWNEGTVHANINIGLKKFAFLTAATYSSFGDLRAGNNRNPFYGDFGLRREYVTRINGMDSIVKNDDPNVQKNTAYTQLDLMQKVLYRQNDKISHTLNLQYSTSSNLPRYDRLTDVRSGKLRWAEWYYGPQDRLMASYQLDATNLKGWFNQVRAGVNYQAIEESRYQRALGVNDLQNRIENVGVIGWNVDARRLAGRHELTIGTDGQRNDVRTKAFKKNIVTNAESPLDTRYPDGGSNMTYAAVYGQHLYKIIPGKLILNDGVRLNYVGLESRFKDKTFFPFPYDKISYNTLAWSGNVGLVYLPGTRWRIAANASTGFRAPNVDDIGKVFESAAGVQLSVPNKDLKPEYTYNADMGVTYLVSDALKLEATGFYTWFRDAIVTDKFQLNGADSVLYNGGQTAVVALQNKAKAYVYGFNAAVTARLMPDVTLYATINHTFGRYRGANDQEVPLDHIPPTFGKVSLRYQPKQFYAEAFSLFNGWKRLSEYNPFGEDNQQYATVNGMPAWFTLNLRAGKQIIPNLNVEVALENILDTHYRTFASGISAPGRNLVVTARARF